MELILIFTSLIFTAHYQCTVNFEVGAFIPYYNDKLPAEFLSDQMVKKPTLDEAPVPSTLKSAY